MLESKCSEKFPDVGGNGDDVDGDGDGDVNGFGNKHSCSRRGRAENDLGRAKTVILYPFLKAKKQFSRKNKRASCSCCSSSSSTTTSITATRTISSVKRVSSGPSVVDGSVNQGCGFCFIPFKNLDSKSGSSPSNPNDRKFTHEMLRVLIEKNDFYSKESNPH